MAVEFDGREVASCKLSSLTCVSDPTRDRRALRITDLVVSELEAACCPPPGTPTGACEPDNMVATIAEAVRRSASGSNLAALCAGATPSSLFETSHDFVDNSHASDDGIDDDINNDGSSAVVCCGLTVSIPSSAAPVSPTSAKADAPPESPPKVVSPCPFVSALFGLPSPGSASPDPEDGEWRLKNPFAGLG